MYCNRCGKEFETWKNDHGYEQNRHCKTCYPMSWGPMKDLSGKDHYCITCGKILPKILKRGKSGSEYWTSGPFKFCSEHKPVIQKSSEEKTCERCGGEFASKRKARYCPECRPIVILERQKSGKYRGMHVKASLAWQLRNREKQAAQNYSRIYGKEVTVVYECPCNYPRKHNHHFSYEIRFFVIRLCPVCHRAEHARLRALQKNKQAI